MEITVSTTNTGNTTPIANEAMFEVHAIAKSVAAALETGDYETADILSSLLAKITDTLVSAI